MALIPGLFLPIAKTLSNRFSKTSAQGIANFLKNKKIEVLKKGDPKQKYMDPGANKGRNYGPARVKLGNTNQNLYSVDKFGVLYDDINTLPFNVGKNITREKTITKIKGNFLRANKDGIYKRPTQKFYSEINPLPNLILTKKLKEIVAASKAKGIDKPVITEVRKEVETFLKKNNLPPLTLGNKTNIANKTIKREIEKIDGVELDIPFQKGKNLSDATHNYLYGGKKAMTKAETMTARKQAGLSENQALQTNIDTKLKKLQPTYDQMELSVSRGHAQDIKTIQSAIGFRTKGDSKVVNELKKHVEFGKLFDKKGLLRKEIATTVQRNHNMIKYEKEVRDIFENIDMSKKIGDTTQLKNLSNQLKTVVDKMKLEKTYIYIKQPDKNVLGFKIKKLGFDPSDDISGYVGRSTTKQLDLEVDDMAKSMLELGYNDGGRVVSAAHKANPLEIGGLVGGKEKFGGVSGSNFKGIGQTNKVGTIHSMLAGIGAGIIDIPKGAFSLGASLVDLGLGTDHAAKVEKFFNDLTNLDEKAEESFAGEMTRIITNLGIPGSQAFKIGSRLTKQALVARKKNQYFDLTDKKMEARMQDALNAGGRLLTTAGGAAGIGVSDAIFVGDPEQVGTIGDMFGGGPTALNPNDEDNAAREVMNRMKFGLESSLLAGIIGGTGSAIKTAVKRSGERDYANSRIDKIFSKFRPRGNKPQQFFDMERGQIGIRQADVNRAQEIQRGVDKHIDAIFPQLKNTFNKTTQETRSKLLKDLNETLLSGDPEISGVTGEFKFGAMDPSLLSRDTARLRKLGAKNPKAIFDSFYDMRAEWNDMFSALGTRMDPKSRAEFGKTFGQKMSDYLGSTYEIFQNKGLIPITQFKPGEEALAKATAMFKQSAKEAGEEITDEQAESYAMQVIKSARLPKGIATGAEKSSNAYFKAPDFFINKTVLSDLEFKGMVNLAELTPESRKVIDNLLGKIEDPTQTILGGTARLSMITRRNQFLDDLLKASDEAKVDKKDGFFYTDEREAINVFGAENVRKIEMDPGKTLEAGKTNPLNGLYAHKGVAEALEQTSQNILGESALANVYTNFILYPKAASQLAKTVLSPVTHVRNFVSAGAFAAGNGIIPNAEAFKTAYKSLQVPLKGSREQNEFYRKLLKLGVVNSNVRLGDLQNLLSDVKFGSSSATIPGLRRLAKQGSRLKKGAEEFYTAEDDFWKITSFAMERQRYADAYKKSGIVKSADELDEIAADIVRNNIPNYDYVNDFVKGLRKFPIGNFVSFPAEIMRTSGNILHRAFKEINFKQTLADGRVIKPLSGIGYKRLMGFGATAVVIPTGVVEGAKAIYDVSGAEMDALRRFVPDWSKNSTLIPIRDEDGSLKYIDFSHANAYDTMIRPFMTMKNAIQDGAEDEAPVMQSVFKGLYEGIGETISPFVSEAIWTQAATDIFLRGGRTKTGQRLYTDQTPFGEKASIIASHLVETQLPGSIGTFERLGLAVTSKPDEYGREYELTDEALGFMGMRAVKVDPITSMKFKIADYTTGVNNSRREFTRPLLKGGPVTPEQIVDRYMVANEQLFNVQKNMNKDYYAARILGSNQDALNLEFKDRISNVALNAIKAGQFKPFIPSENILKSFAENARNIGQTNPYENARATIDRLARQYSKANVMFGEFPFNDNPFTKVEESSLPTSGMGDTNVTLPNLGLNIQGSNLGSVNNLGTTLAKLEQVDKVFDL